MMPEANGGGRRKVPGEGWRPGVGSGRVGAGVVGRVRPGGWGAGPGGPRVLGLGFRRLGWLHRTFIQPERVYVTME